MLNPRHRRSPKNLTINDVYPDWLDGKGVVASMDTAPWASSTSLQALDYAYHGVHSGDKFASQVLYNFLDESGEITTAGRAKIAEMLMSMYGPKWLHLWGLYNTGYNPLHTYTITETEEVSTSGSDTTGTLTSDTVNRGQSVQEGTTHNNTEVRNWTDNEVTDEDRQEDTVAESTRTPALTESEIDASTVTVDSEKVQRPNLSEATTEESVVVVDGSVVTTPATSEVITEEATTTVDGTVIKTPNTTDTLTVDEVVDTDSTQTRTPNTQERTVLSEEIQSTGTEDTEVTYGHVVDSTEEAERDSALNVWGFNSAEGVPKQATHEEDSKTTNTTNSGNDVTDKDTTGSTERDSTSTTNVTGTETTVLDETRDKDATETRRITGTETTDDDTTTTVDSEKRVVKSGTETVENDTTTETDASKTVLTTGTDTTTEDTETQTTGSKMKTSGGKEDMSSDENKTIDGTVTKSGSGADTGSEYGSSERNVSVDDSTTRNGQQTVDFETERNVEASRTKSGNMFKAPAELLSLDRDFWMKDFFEIVFTDIDKLLTLAVFSESPVNRKYF